MTRQDGCENEAECEVVLSVVCCVLCAGSGVFVCVLMLMVMLLLLLLRVI